MTDRQPHRIQRPYIWPRPREAVNCARPTRWGNPFDTADEYRAWVRGAYEQRIRRGRRVYIRPTLAQIRTELGGQDLACHCKPGARCHADVLLELANPEGRA